MPAAIAHPEYSEFLDWCRQRSDALSRKAIVIADNLDNSNRTGRLYRGYLAAVHFLRENSGVHDWLRAVPLSERQSFDYDSPEFGARWSEFMAKHGEEHVILKHILPT